MPHSWRLQKEIFFYVNVGVVMCCIDRKSKGGLSEIRCSAVRTIHEQYIKLHEHHYLTYIQMIDFQMSQNSMQTTFPVLLHKPVKYDMYT